MLNIQNRVSGIEPQISQIVNQDLFFKTFTPDI
jgi:hypothetical protein